jgi:hypothetical protein
LIKRSGVAPVWHGYVPVLNALAILKIIERPWYWLIFLFFVPGINLLMLTIMHVELGIAFGRRSTKAQWLMGALPWVGLAQLSMGVDKYMGPSGEKLFYGQLLWQVLLESILSSLLLYLQDRWKEACLWEITFL